MRINALMMDSKDNVVTCVTEIKKGEQVIYKNGETIKTLLANEDIPYCHKIAIIDIAEQGDVIKYGEMIGRTTEPITVGCWVSHKNIYSVPRKYEEEYEEV